MGEGEGVGDWDRTDGNKKGRGGDGKVPRPLVHRESLLLSHWDVEKVSGFLFFMGKMDVTK